jgi:molecular chaperone DnaJ
LGAEIEIPTMDGMHTLKIPEGTQSGTVFKIRGKGVPSVNSHGKGDLLVETKVLTPAKLNKRQRELLLELGALGHVENKPENKTLFSKVKDMFS